MPRNAKNTPTVQTALKTPLNAARESQSVFSNLSAGFWQDIENDGLTMIHSISPLRGCKSPNANTDLQNPTPKKRWKRRRLIRTDQPLPSGDGNPDERNASKDVIVADNSSSIKRHKSRTRRKRCRRKSGLMQKGTPVLVSPQVGAAENIHGESCASAKPTNNSKQTDAEQVFGNSTLNCGDPLKAPVDPLATGQKRAMTEVAPTQAKRLKKNRGRKKGIESAAHSPDYHSGKTKGGNTSGNITAPLGSSTPVGVSSTEHLVEPHRTSADLDRFETPKSSRLQQVSTLRVKTQKCQQNTFAPGKSLEEAEVIVQSASKNHQGVEGVGALHPQRIPEMPSPANLSLNFTLGELLGELSTSKRSRLSVRLAKAKIACHEEKRQRRISLKRKQRGSIGELDVTPGKMSQPGDDLHTAKFQDIKSSASPTNPNEIHSISDESLVENHHRTQSKVPQVPLEQEVDINEAPAKNGPDFETPKQQRVGAGLTCALCSCSCKCPPSGKTPSTASEGVQTSGNVSEGVQITPVVLRPDELELEHTKTLTHSSLHSQSCQTDCHETQTQTGDETTSYASQIPPEDCSALIPPSDQTEEPRTATVTGNKSFFDSLLGESTHSKQFSKPSQLPGKETEHSTILTRFFESLTHVPAHSKSPPKPTPLLRRQSHRRIIKSAESSDSTRQTDPICSQSDSEEATTLKSHCLSPVIQLVKPSASQSMLSSKPSQLSRKEIEDSKVLKRFFESRGLLIRSKSPPKPTPLLQRQSHRRRINFAESSDSTRQTDPICSQSDSEEATTLKSHCLSPVIQLVKPSASQSMLSSKPSQLSRKEIEDSKVLKRFFESRGLLIRSKSPPKPTPLLQRQSHRRRINFAESSDSTRQTDSICSQSSSEEATTLKSHCLSPVIQLVKPRPAPSETLPKGLPLSFMKFPMHCGRRPIGKRQMRMPQELFSSSGESDSDVGRARAAAQRFINMTEGRDSDDGLGDRLVDSGEKVVASQQVHRKKYRRFLDDSDSGSNYVDDVDHADGEERNSEVGFEDGGGRDCSNECTDMEEYIDNDETRTQQVNTSDEEDTDHTIVGTCASDDGGEGDAVSSNDSQEEWSEELDDEDYDVDDEDYGNAFILDQAYESRLEDDPESDGYSDTDDSDTTDGSQSENSTEEDIIRDRQQRQTTDNKFHSGRLSPRKNRRRILAGIFSSSEESSSIDSRAAELAPGEVSTPEGSLSCDDMPDQSKVSVGERQLARQLPRRKSYRNVLNDTSSSGNGTDHNSSDEDSEDSFLDDDESQSEQQVKLKERLKPTGLLTVKGKMLKIFRQQAERKLITNTCSTKGKQAKSNDSKQRDIEKSHDKTASKDKQQEPNGQAAKSTDSDKKSHRDSTDLKDASDTRQGERKERTDDGDLHNDENVDGHANDNREEGDVLKGDTEDIGGSDSDDTSLNFTDYGSSDDCPELYDGLLKRSKSQRKKLKMTGLLDVKRKMLKTRRQTSDGKGTKSRNVKKKGKTNRQQNTYEEHRKGSRSAKRGGPKRSGQAGKSEEGDANSDANNFVQDDVLGDDEDVDGHTNNDKSEGGGVKGLDKDIGGLDSDDTLMNFTGDDNRGVSGGASVMKPSTQALQSKEVAQNGLLTGRKSAKSVKSKKSLNLTGSSEYDPDNNNGLVKKTRPKKSPKLTGLLSEEEMKNRRATKRKRTKLRSTKEDGKKDHQQVTSEEQHGEPRSNEKGLNDRDQDLDDGKKDDASLKLSDGDSHVDKSQTRSLRQSKELTQLNTKKNTTEGLLKERKSPQRKKVKKSLDQAQRKKDGPRNHDGLLYKSKSHKKLTQKTLPEMVDMGKSKKNPVLTESMEHNLDLDNCNERVDNGKPIESPRLKAPSEKTGLRIFADKGEVPKLLKQQAERIKTRDKKTKSKDSKKDGKTNHREKHQQVARSTKKDVNHHAAKSMDNESDGDSNKVCDNEVANCDISEESYENEEVQEDDVDDDANEDNDDGSQNFSDDENHGVGSRTSFSGQSKKKTLAKKNAQEGGLKKRNSPKSKKTTTSCDLTQRKEDDPDYSRPLEKLRQKTLPKKTKTQKESKKRKTKVARKTKQVDVQCSPVEKTSEDVYGETTIDNTGEDAGSTDHEGDVGIVSKTCVLKKSTKSKTAKAEKAVKKALMKESHSPKKSDFRKSIKTMEPTEVVAGLMNERKSTKKKKKLSTGGKSVDTEHGGFCSQNSSLTQSTKFTKLKTKEVTKEGGPMEKKTPKMTKSKKNLVWAKLINSTRSSGKSNSMSFEENVGVIDNSDCYIDAVDVVFSGKTQDEREGDLYDDGSSEDESLDGHPTDDEDRAREGTATRDGDKYLKEAVYSRGNGSRRKDVGRTDDGKMVSACGRKTKSQIGGDGLRNSTDEKGGDVQENWAEGDASKDDDEGVDGFNRDDPSLPHTGEGSRDVSYKDRNKEAERGSRKSSLTVEEVLEDEHPFSSEEDSDEQSTPSGFLDEGEISARQRNACPFDHMSKSYRGKKRGCKCMIGNSPRRGRSRREDTENPVLTGSESLDSNTVKSKPAKTRLRNPPTVNGLLMDKGKMLTLFKQEAARKMTENNSATVATCKTSCNFGEMNYRNVNPIMYIIKSDTNRAICESLITPMPQEWEEPRISSKDREDHRSALHSIFYELLLKRGKKNRIATRRFGKVKIKRGPSIKEVKKANTAEKRRLKKLEAEVKSDGWIEYDMLPAVYQEPDATDFIKEIK